MCKCTIVKFNNSIVYRKFTKNNFGTWYTLFYAAIYIVYYKKTAF